MNRWNALFTGTVALLFIFVVVLINRKPAVSPAVAEQAADASVAGASGARVPVLVELFTSEGCSSCPPADDLLTRLEQEQPIPGAEVIVLSQHVDYWNRLGWTDPYSAAEFSARQGDYSTAFNLDSVYTPQMVVDGQTEFVGSNQEQAREAITSAARSPKANITLTKNTGGASADAIPLEVRIEKLPRTSAGDAAEVLLAIAESNLRSSVARGENSGRRLTHTAVVRQLSVIGTVSAGSNEAFTATPVVTLSNAWKRANLRAVVFVQERASRKVLGAATTALAQ